jgi:hypothetical protein
MARNRIIYNSKTLLIQPNATGWATGTITGSTTFLTGTYLQVLPRIQSLNYSAAINRKDINQINKLARIDSVAIDSPTVSLSYDYYLTDGINERLLGFNIANTNDNKTQVNPTTSALSGILEDLQGNNYYILTTDEGEDATNTNFSQITGGALTCVGIGNGFISNYSIDCSVGNIPTASVQVEGFNARTDYNATGFAGGLSPAIDIVNATKLAAAYNYGLTLTGTVGGTPTGNIFATANDLTSVSALLPGGITLTLPDASGMTSISGANSCHIQRFAVSVPLSRTVLKRLGNTFGYSRSINVPINIDVTIEAIVSELKNVNIFDMLTSAAQTNTLQIALNDSNGVPKMNFSVKGCVYRSESYSNSIGPNETVTITYQAQVGSFSDTANGLFVSGAYRTNAYTSGVFLLGRNKDNLTNVISF